MNQGLALNEIRENSADLDAATNNNLNLSREMMDFERYRNDHFITEMSSIVRGDA